MLHAASASGCVSLSVLSMNRAELVVVVNSYTLGPAGGSRPQGMAVRAYNASFYCMAPCLHASCAAYTVPCTLMDAQHSTMVVRM